MTFMLAISPFFPNSFIKSFGHSSLPAVTLPPTYTHSHLLYPHPSLNA